MTEDDEALLEECIIALSLVGFSTSDILRFVALGASDPMLAKRVDELKQ